MYTGGNLADMDTWTFMYDAYLSKWNTSGDLEWEQIFNYEIYDAEDPTISSLWGENASLYSCGYATRNMLWYALKTEDGTKGTEVHEIQYSGKLVLRKWNPNGNPSWTRLVDNYTSVYSLYGDETYLYTLGEAYTPHPYSSYNYSDVLTKWDKSGNQIWNRSWSSYNISITSQDPKPKLWTNGKQIYISETTLLNTTHNIQLKKWDVNGTSIWNVTYAQITNETVSNIVGDEKGVYLAGNSNFCQSLFMKIDEGGNVVWKKIGNNNTSFADVLYYENFTYTIGHCKPIPWASYDMYLVKWDSNGTQLWNTSWGTFAYSEWGTTLCCNGDNFYASGEGRSLEYNGGLYDGLLVKWDMDGKAPTFTKPQEPTLRKEGNKLIWLECQGAERYYIFNDSDPIDEIREIQPMCLGMETEYALPKDEKFHLYFAVAAGNDNAISDISNLMYIDYIPKKIPGMPLWGILVVGFLSLCMLAKKFNMLMRRERFY